MSRTEFRGAHIWTPSVAVFVVMISMSAAIVTTNMRERQFFRHLSSVDVDGILQNSRLIDKYMKCLLKTGKCDPAMRDLRTSLPLILQHLCENKCNDKERRNLQKVFQHIKYRRTSEWERLAKLYDPKGLYVERVEAFINPTPKPTNKPA